MTSTGSIERLLDAVDVRAPEPALAGAVHHLDAPGILARRARRRPRRCRRATDRRRPARATFGCCISPSTSTGRFVALVVGRDDDERRRLRHGCRPSNRSDEICSDTRPIEKDHDAQQDQQHRRVRHVRLRGDRPHARTPAPTANAAALTGRKIRSGLKIVITFSRIRKNRDAVGRRAGSSTRPARRAARSARSARCSPP